jgi:hypothetical protein
MWQHLYDVLSVSSFISEHGSCAYLQALPPTSPEECDSRTMLSGPFEPVRMPCRLEGSVET